MNNTYTGKCPYIKDTHTISVNYVYVPILGTLTSNYKKGTFDCSFLDECPQSKNCPIYQNAPVCLAE